MAHTFTKPFTPAKIDPMYVVSVPVLSTAVVALGTVVLYDVSNHYISAEMNAVTDDATVLGVALGESNTGQTGPIPVATRGIFKATLVSAAYVFGESLMYDASADNGSLITDGGNNTIAWFWSLLSGQLSTSASITAGYVWFDVTRLAIAADKLWTISHA